jgi:4-hydroxy-3-polyprenylbenzoate decarboxylase
MLVAASFPVPEEFDGLLWAGLLRGKALDVVKARTSGLEVAADPELVVEGHLDPADPPVEVVCAGSGEHYELRRWAPVMRVDAVTHRNNPVMPVIIPGSFGDTRWLNKAVERLLLPMIASAAPEVVDCALPSFGGSLRYALVSIRKRYAGQARKVASALWGISPLMSVKFVIIVDEHVDVQDERQVWAQVGANVDPARDIFAHCGPALPSDHSSNATLANHLGMDATDKIPGEAPGPWPQPLCAAEQVRQLVERRWSEYGIP